MGKVLLTVFLTKLKDVKIPTPKAPLPISIRMPIFSSNFTGSKPLLEMNKDQL